MSLNSGHGLLFTEINLRTWLCALVIEKGLWCQPDLVLVTALSLSGHVILGKLLKLPKLQFFCQ